MNATDSIVVEALYRKGKAGHDSKMMTTQDLMDTTACTFDEITETLNVLKEQGLTRRQSDLVMGRDPGPEDDVELLLPGVVEGMRSVGTLDSTRDALAAQVRANPDGYFRTDEMAETALVPVLDARAVIDDWSRSGGLTAKWVNGEMVVQKVTAGFRRDYRLYGV